MYVTITILLWFAAISAGLMAGVYFTFSAFVMRALDALEPPAGMAAMRSINRVILQSPFLPLFMASSAACAALVGLGLLHWDEAGAWQTVAGGAVYVLGMFAVTASANVPLNNALEASALTAPEGPAMWNRYMRRWTVWNHLRTLACCAALVLLVWALVARG